MISKFKKKSILTAVTVVVVALVIGTLELISSKSSIFNENKHTINNKSTLDKVDNLKRDEKVVRNIITEQTVKNKEIPVKNQQPVQKAQPTDNKNEDKKASSSDEQIITLPNDTHKIRVNLEYYLKLPNDIVEISNLPYSSLKKLQDKYNTKKSVYEYYYGEISSK